MKLNLLNQPLSTGKFSKRRAIVLIVMAYSITLGVLANALRSQYGFPLDDSYIHQTMARNLALTAVLGFHAGQPSPGSTSLLWAYVQATNFKFLRLDPVLFNLAIGWALLVIIGTLLFALARQDHISLQYSFALAVIPAFSGNFIWLGLIGMEHLLFVALALVSIYFWFESGRTTAFLAGASFGLLALTRPEAIILGPLVLFVVRKAKRTLRDAIHAMAAWSVAIAVLLASNWHISHSLLPGTMKGRSWLYFHSSGGPHSLYSIFGFFFKWVNRPAMDFSLWRARPVTHFYLALVLVFVPIGLACIGAFWLLRQNTPRIRFLFLLASVHFCFYLLAFPSDGHGGRYQPLNLLLLFPIMFFGLSFLLRRALRASPEIAEIIAIFMLFVASAASLWTWWTVTLDGIAHINGTHGEAAAWLQHNTSPTDRIAAFDIGKISYSSARDIIDLGGLTDPSFSDYLSQDRVLNYMKEQHAQLVILPSGRFAADLGLSQRMTILTKFCSPPETWFIGFAYTGNAEQCQVIYKLP